MFKLLKIFLILFMALLCQNTATAQSITPGYPIKDSTMAENIRHAIIASNDLGDCISSTPNWVYNKWKGVIFKDKDGNRYRNKQTVMMLTSLDRTRCSLIYFWTKQSLNTTLKQWEYYSVDEKNIKTVKIACIKNK